MTAGSRNTFSGVPSAIAAPWCSTSILRGQRRHRPHDMLDQQDRQPVAVELAQDRHDTVGFGRPQPGHDFIEQQQLRPGRQRARHLEALAVGESKARGDLRAFAEQIELRHDLTCKLARFRQRAGVHQRADHDVVFDAQRRKRLDQLEGPADPAPGDLVGAQAVDPFTGERDRSLVWVRTRLRSC